MTTYVGIAETDGIGALKKSQLPLHGDLILHAVFEDDGRLNMISNPTDIAGDEVQRLSFLALSYAQTT